VERPKLPGALMMPVIRRRLARSLSLALFIFLAALAPGLSGSAALHSVASTQATGPADWSQAGQNPEHTSLSPETLGTTFSIAWRHAFQPERVFPQVQAIVYYDGTNRNVFVGTEQGHLYALDAATGTQRWVYTAGGPILNSVAAANGLVYVAAMDGSVAAVNSETGVAAWTTQVSPRLGISAAPVFADNHVYIAGRDGGVSALDPLTGAVIWTVNLGAPVLMTPAADEGNLFVGTLDRYVYALSGVDGHQIWKSAQLPGLALEKYYPVVTGGEVLVYPDPATYLDNLGIQPGFPFSWFASSSDYSWLTTNGPAIAAGNAASVSDFVNAQNTVMANFAANPANFATALHVLDETTGQETVHVPNFNVQQHNGASPPPCVDSSGLIVLPVMFIQSGWGRLNLATQRYMDILYDGTNWDGTPWTAGNSPAGFGNEDENMTVTCSQNYVFGMHYQEQNANYTGAFNLITRRWTAFSKGWTNGQMADNTQSGGADPATISNGMIYHISYHELIARRSQ